MTCPRLSCEDSPPRAAAGAAPMLPRLAAAAPCAPPPGDGPWLPPARRPSRPAVSSCCMSALDEVPRAADIRISDSWESLPSLVLSIANKALYSCGFSCASFLRAVMATPASGVYHHHTAAHICQHHFSNIVMPHCENAIAACCIVHWPHVPPHQRRSSSDETVLTGQQQM